MAATIQNGMPLVYTGQEVSMNKRLRFFEKDTVDWKGKSLASFYQRVLALKDSQPALANGALGGTQEKLEVKLFRGQEDRVYAYTRAKDSNVVAVLMNFGDQDASVEFPNAKYPGSYRDWFDKSNGATIGAPKGFYLRIPAHGYRVIVRESPR
jgi:hypothetical protein